MTKPQTDQLGSTVATTAMSVVICTRNRGDKISAAVASVLANDHPSFDLTIIDQSDTPETMTAVQPFAERDPRVRYVHLDQAGLSRAYNAGIHGTVGPLIAFTDDDCLVPADWLRRIERAFGEDPSADLLYGQVLALPTDAPEGAVTPTLQFSKAERLSRKDGFRVIGMGANFAARRRLFDTIGGFDEILGGGGPLRSSQDFDLAYRAFRSDSIIILRPEVTLLHDGLREAEDWPAVLRNYGIGDGAFYSKHIRCGDPYALLLLSRQVGSLGGRMLVKRLLGQRPRTEYVCGIFAGIREGLRFPVDRRQRQYRSPRREAA
jgi:GT2 family glycosyltransferase